MATLGNNSTTIKNIHKQTSGKVGTFRSDVVNKQGKHWTSDGLSWNILDFPENNYFHNQQAGDPIFVIKNADYDLM